MAEWCNWCGWLKMTPDVKCACSGSWKKKEKKPKPIPKVSKKRAKRFKEEWTEAQLFEKIFKTRLKYNENKCQVCKTIVKEAVPWCFPHILPKSKFPLLRMFENNIWFVCSDVCHRKFDSAVVLYKKDKWLKDLENTIVSWKKPRLVKYINQVNNE